MTFIEVNDGESPERHKHLTKFKLSFLSRFSIRRQQGLQKWGPGVTLYEVEKVTVEFLGFLLVFHGDCIGLRRTVWPHKSDQPTKQCHNSLSQNAPLTMHCQPYDD